jgi:uncharacterized RDD family membrane protein YckC
MAVQRRYQTFWPRFWAGWIDSLLLIPFMGVDWLVQQVAEAPVLLALWFVLYTYAYDIYSVTMHAKYGQTLGKMAMGIRVLSASEAKLSFRQALLRDAVPIFLASVSVINWAPRIFSGARQFGDNFELTWVDEVSIFGSLIWFVAELATMLTNSKRRAIHDFIAGSVVVRTENETRSVGEASDA